MFSVFLACSFVIWLVSNLSESYESRAMFGLEYERVPEGLALEKGIQQELRLKLRASGFRFLTRSFGERSLKINLNSLNEDNNGTYYLTRSQLSGQIEKQLTNAVSLLELELDSDTLYIAAYPLVQKTVPIRPQPPVDCGKELSSLRRCRGHSGFGGHRRSGVRIVQDHRNKHPARESSGNFLQFFRTNSATSS